MANIPPRQRTALLNEIGRLPGEYVLLDLGAGTALNTLGFFGAVHNGLLVTTFESPAIMNLLSFLKNFAFWIIAVAVQHDEPLYQRLTAAFRATMDTAPVTVDQLLQEIEHHNAALASDVRQRLQHYVPRILFNMGEGPEELAVTRQIDRAMENGLSMRPEYFGFVHYDRIVRQAMVRERAVSAMASDARVVQDMERIAERIAKFWDREIPDSGVLLRNSIGDGSSHR